MTGIETYRNSSTRHLASPWNIVEQLGSQVVDQKKHCVQENEDVEKILKAVDTDGVARRVSKTTVIVSRSDRQILQRTMLSQGSERETEVGFNN